VGRTTQLGTSDVSAGDAQIATACDATGTEVPCSGRITPMNKRTCFVLQSTNRPRKTPDATHLSCSHKCHCAVLIEQKWNAMRRTLSSIPQTGDHRGGTDMSRCTRTRTTVDVRPQLMTAHARYALNLQATIRRYVGPLGDGLRRQTELLCERGNGLGFGDCLGQTARARLSCRHALNFKARLGKKIKHLLNGGFKERLINCSICHTALLESACTRRASTPS
jgi:hypothetical protein